MRAVPIARPFAALLFCIVLPISSFASDSARPESIRGEVSLGYESQVDSTFGGSGGVNSLVVGVSVLGYLWPTKLDYGPLAELSFLERLPYLKVKGGRSKLDFGFTDGVGKMLGGTVRLAHPRVPLEIQTSREFLDADLTIASIAPKSEIELRQFGVYIGRELMVGGAIRKDESKTSSFIVKQRAEGYFAKYVHEFSNMQAISVEARYWKIDDERPGIPTADNKEIELLADFYPDPFKGIGLRYVHNSGGQRREEGDTIELRASLNPNTHVGFQVAYQLFEPEDEFADTETAVTFSVVARR